ncbi:pre-rRNA-processing protein TSR4 [Geosmithia morbida]|uniref:Pre-rRNA-processing protein TSR4 n=1 Tax=Geosmithia morbida TaxID=1094350 RepID=A0A9P4Z244_9HYPO|nr:pre-rRNA-processing protein TSR4 [Geosmithia morbida]KAF4126022.1 pre-rRNA-processing protein TSR4 [Geosmithia morbida]
MTSYDSDSSEGEFQETNVLLGYASKEAEEGEDVISRLGGTPEWLDDTTPSAALARCKVCNDMMVLLLQINGELPERFPGHDRRIYVFGCRRSSCRRRDGSIRAIRGVRVWKEVEDTRRELQQEDEEKKKQEEQRKEEDKKNKGPGLGTALFGGSTGSFGAAGGNPFSTGGGGGDGNPFSSGGAASNPFSTEKKQQSEEKEKPRPKAEEASKETLTRTFAETLSLNSTTGSTSTALPPPEPWPSQDELPSPYPMLYLCDAEYETLDPTPQSSKGLPANARVEGADAEEPSILDREAFESTMDAAFQKFADRLSQNPDQVIRYEFGGTPLLYSKNDDVAARLAKGPAVGVPGCANCGGRRAFEVQMTPHAITELEEDDLSLEGMEWGTIIVAVCERDCRPNGVGLGQTGYLEEWAGVQWEELVDRK